MVLPEFFLWTAFVLFVYYILLPAAESAGFVALDEALVEELDTSISDLDREDDNSNPPPEQSALKKHELHMPTERPDPHTKTPHPPFEGERVELGERT